MVVENYLNVWTLVVLVSILQPDMSCAPPGSPYWNSFEPGVKIGEARCSCAARFSLSALGSAEGSGRWAPDVNRGEQGLPHRGGTSPAGRDALVSRNALQLHPALHEERSLSASQQCHRS